MPNLHDSDTPDFDPLSGLRAVVHIVDAAREEERRKLACELHDTVVQPLASLTMSLQSFERQPNAASAVETLIRSWKQEAQEALAALRSTLAGISWRLSEGTDLSELLQRQLQPEFQQRGIRLTVEQHEWPVDLPLDWVSQLYLIVREALTNALKHACASAVRVMLHAGPKYLAVYIEDDGSGLHTDEEVSPSAPATGQGLGITSMQARVKALGGRLEMAAAPTTGTRIAIYLPYSATPGRQSATPQAH